MTRSGDTLKLELYERLALGLISIASMVAIGLLGWLLITVHDLDTRLAVVETMISVIEEAE